MNLKQWRILPLDRENAARIAQEENLPLFLSMMLDVRGVKSKEQVQALLDENEKGIDPYALPGMKQAVTRIQAAIEHFERIAVYGDYDADGVTATAMLYSYLTACGADVLFYIPDREGEGYGMNVAAVKALHSRGVALIITVDNGIASAEEVQSARELGMDVVITDHHRPQAVLPEAAAVVDPHLPGGTEESQVLAGVGVAFQLMAALEGEDGVEMLLENYADLIAIGTIGDVVPLTGENRKLVTRGLQALKTTDKPGLRILMEKAALRKENISAVSVAFTIVPRINAVGRLGAPERAVQLLLCDEEEMAETLAQEVCEDNEMRRNIEKEVYEQALSLLQENTDLLFDRVMVLEGTGWHNGVIGIVASRISERYGKPCIILSKDGPSAKGSGRSVEGFSLFHAVDACKDLLLQYGGHTMAAGLNLCSEAIPTFRRKINEYAAAQGEMPVQQVRMDCKLRPEALSVELPHLLKPLEPYGTGNATPLFGLYKMKLEEIFPVGNGNHLRLTFSKAGARVCCMKFGTAKKNFPFSAGEELDLAVTIATQFFRGEESLTITIREMRLSNLPEEDLLTDWRLYEKCRRKEKLTAEEKKRLYPDREVFAAIYRYLKLQTGETQDAVSTYSRTGVAGFARFLVALDVLAEQGLIQLETDSVDYKISLRPVTGKRDLFASPLLREIE